MGSNEYDQAPSLGGVNSFLPVVRWRRLQRIFKAVVAFHSRFRIEIHQLFLRFVNFVYNYTYQIQYSVFGLSLLSLCEVNLHVLCILILVSVYINL